MRTFTDHILTIGGLIVSKHYVSFAFDRRLSDPESIPDHSGGTGIRIRNSPRVTVEVMANYQRHQEFPLSEIQSQAFAQHAEEHNSASWSGARIDFEPWGLHVSLERHKEQGDDIITISFREGILLILLMLAGHLLPFRDSSFR